MGTQSEHAALHDLHDHVVLIAQSQKSMLTQITLLTTRGAKLMETMATLQAKIDELTQAQAAESARQIAQDAATASQIAALQAALEALQNQGGLSPENQAALDAAIPKINAVIAALNASQPTEVDPQA